MSIIYVDAREPRRRAIGRWLRRYGLLLLSILLIVAAANAVLIFAVNLSQTWGYPPPHLALRLVTTGRLRPGVRTSFWVARTQGRDLHYTWDFGDGTQAPTTAQTVTHIYTKSGSYTVTVIAVDAVNQQAQQSLPIIVFPSPPTATIVYQQAPHSLTITLDASESRGSGLQYTWNFGDGAPPQTTSDTSTSYTYSKAGTFTVKLTVTDSVGQTASASTQVRVSPPLPPAPSGVIETIGFTSVNQPLTFTFAPDSSYIAAYQGPWTYLWNFGDSSTSTLGPTVRHSYTQASPSAGYTVTVKVTDQYGQSATFQTNIAVVPTPTPTPMLTSTPTP